MRRAWGRGGRRKGERKREEDIEAIASGHTKNLLQDSNENLNNNGDKMMM